MDSVLAFFTPTELALAFVVGLLAGTVKGIVGFAMPLVMVSGLNLFLPTEISLAGLIVPTLVTNVIQALREGIGPAWATVRQFRIFLSIGGLFLFASAQLVPILPGRSLLLIIGVFVTLFAATQFIGWSFVLRSASTRTEALFAAIAGVLGGLTGIWGPPTVIYLTALGTAKAAQMRIQGVIYTLGAIALAAAHVTSGVLNAQTLPFSVFMVISALTGLYIGTRLNDRIDQNLFRKATLAVLTLAGASMVWSGLSA
ncbi:MAG: sulfite exporter TauE/SafE family protein [Pseudomonadota bacterium]